MNIVITAGGTTEHIDAVRAITNTGTGTLATYIVERILFREKIVGDLENLFYIYTPKAKKPAIKDNRIVYIEVDDTNSVAAAVEKVLSENKIDWFIHAMAISDYYVDFVTTVQGLVNDICTDDNSSLAANILSGNSRLDNSRKLSSNEDNLVVMLKKTPKIIGMIKEKSPDTHLIGFKLLNNVTDDELINVAYNLLLKNNCEYVVANDSAKIDDTKHEALIINANKEVVFRPMNNEEIAHDIAAIIYNK